LLTEWARNGGRVNCPGFSHYTWTNFWGAGQIEIAANWYSSEADYPIYSVGFYGSDYLNDKLQAYKKHNKVGLNSNGDKLLFCPNPDDFDLERDFNMLLDEFVETFSK